MLYPAKNNIIKHTHTHTHTHTLQHIRTFIREFAISGILHATVDIQSFYGWTWTFFLCVCGVCVCVWNLTMDYPLPLSKSIIGHHWTSTVDVCPRLYGNFSDDQCPWLLTNARAHTHTHTHTHTHKHIFSGLQIHLHVHNAVPFYYLWHSAV